MLKYINLFDIKISTYLLFICISLIVNIVIAVEFFKKTNIKKKQYISILILETIGICMGAKLLDFLIYYRYYTNVVDIFFRGYIFYGGVIGGIILAYFYVKKENIDIEEMFNILIPNILLIYAICKIGCYLNGCCVGIKHIPIQLIESILCFITYLSIIINRKRLIQKDNIIPISCISYSLIRIICDFFRADMSGKIVLNLTISQIMSLFVIFLNIYIIKKHIRKNKLD